MAVGLYIHVPFCHTRCHFCAFYVRIHREDWAQAYLTALQREIRLHAERGTLAGREVETVYFGGGTPTTLAPSQLMMVLSWIQSAFELVSHPEVTVEAHPDTVTADGLTQLRRTGFTRISLGLQSADRQELLRIGRRTEDLPIQQVVEMVRSAGFRSVNLDAIYGLPGQTHAQWMNSMDAIIRCAPDHVSCYALTIEEHSHLYLDQKRGDMAPLDLDLQNEFEDAAAARLTKAGFERYEISNFARPDHACRHNLLYWQDGDYLGLGPSAQSYVNGVRFGNLADLDAYDRSLTAGQFAISESVPLSAQQRRREALIFGLRQTTGLDKTAVQLGDNDAEFAAQIARFIKDGLLEEQAGRIRLTREGRRFADSVAVALL